MLTAFRTLMLLAAALTAEAAGAETIVVKAQGIKFVPDVFQANVGDIIAFRSMSAHYVESVPGMWPEGAPELRSTLNADHDYLVEREGLYVFRCPTHWGGRMGAVMAVGDPAALTGKIAEYEKLAADDKSVKAASPLLKKFRERMGLK